jgi:hypothetical protein
MYINTVYIYLIYSHIFKFITGQKSKIIYDGQKQFPLSHISVDFTIIEHIELNCIEIVGICIPLDPLTVTNNTNVNSVAGSFAISK